MYNGETINIVKPIENNTGKLQKLEPKEISVLELSDKQKELINNIEEFYMINGLKHRVKKAFCSKKELDVYVRLYKSKKTSLFKKKQLIVF